MNTPNQSFAGDVSRLPVKYSFVGGYKFVKSSGKDIYKSHQDLTIIPTLHYKFQGKSDQFDAGIYTIYSNVILGLWYRGIPLKHYKKGVQNNESIVVMAGYKYKNVSFCYSYDFTISLLKIVRTAGAHEISITWVNVKNKKKPNRRLPCPRFQHH
jgi:type IX secretion system PorP/SprF family membrane protein